MASQFPDGLDGQVLPPSLIDGIGDDLLVGGCLLALLVARHVLIVWGKRRKAERMRVAVEALLDAVGEVLAPMGAKSIGAQWRANRPSLDIEVVFAAGTIRMRCRHGVSAHAVAEAAAAAYLDGTEEQDRIEEDAHAADDHGAQEQQRVEDRAPRKSWWQVLGVGQDADYGTVRSAYRDLAMRHHPDRGGDVGTMASINAAMDEAKAVVGEGNRP